MKIFFLGGSFDPPHIGHLEIAKSCLKYCNKFLFIPSKQVPHKKESPYFSSKDRVSDFFLYMINSFSVGFGIAFSVVYAYLAIAFLFGISQYLIIIPVILPFHQTAHIVLKI